MQHEGGCIIFLISLSPAALEPRERCGFSDKTSMINNKCLTKTNEKQNLIKSIRRYSQHSLSICSERETQQRERLMEREAGEARER